MRSQDCNSDGELIHDAFVQVDERVYAQTDLDCQAADDGMTMQEFADECDINVLMQRYETTGVLNHYAKSAPQYIDLSDVPDLHTALAMLDVAQTAFMKLPAHVRREFDNDPAKFVDFAQDEKNADKMREWGLAKPLPEAPTPVKVEIINPPETKSESKSAP